MARVLKGLLIALILLTALAVAVILVRRPQELRRRAAPGDVEAWFLPDEIGGINLGDVFPVYLVLDLSDQEMTGFTIKITYPQDLLTITEDDVSINSAFPDDPDNIILKKVEDGAIYLSAVSFGGATGVLGAADPWVRMSFTVSGFGSGLIRLVNNTEEYPPYQVVGMDGDLTVINRQGGMTVEISYNLASPTSTPTPVPPTPTNTNTPTPTARPTLLSTPTPTPSPTITPTPTPTSTPTPTETPCQKSIGDADCNGAIEMDDFILWLSVYRKIINDDPVTEEEKAAVDFDYSGSGEHTVSLTDFIIWLASYRQTM